MQPTANIRTYVLSVKGSTRNWAAQKMIIFEPQKPLVLGKFLTDYPNVQIAEEIMNGFQFGFRLHYHAYGPRVKTEAPNLPSFYKLSDIARDNIMKEIAKGRMAGPFKS